MNRLERDLSPLQSDWSGNAQAAYIDAKRKWDTAIAEMMQLLNDTGTTVGQSNQDYHSADMRGANSFQIGAELAAPHATRRTGARRRSSCRVNGGLWVPP